MVAGQRWCAILQRAFASMSLATDFGTRAATTEFGKGAREFIERKLSDGLNLTAGPGLSVFEEEPWPTVRVMTASGSIGLPAERLARAVADRPLRATP